MMIFTVRGDHAFANRAEAHEKNHSIGLAIARLSPTGMLSKESIYSIPVEYKFSFAEMWPCAEMWPWKMKIVRTITAYASVRRLTSSHPFLTASGKRVSYGIVAANWLPFGTRLKIPELFGEQVFIVADRMNFRYNDRLDIWMPALRRATSFGIKYAEVVIVSLPSGS